MNYTVDFFLCLLLGFFGGHKFYEKKYKMGLLYVFTVGLFGFGWIFDTVKLFIVAFIYDEDKKGAYTIKEEKKANIRKVVEIEAGHAYSPLCGRKDLR